MRGKLVVGNWKMNGGLAANAALLGALHGRLDGNAGQGARGLRAVPVSRAGASALAATPIAWGAQDVSEHAAGAFTGEVSAAMLVEFGCRYAIVGHSERRQLLRRHGRDRRGEGGAGAGGRVDADRLRRRDARRARGRDDTSRGAAAARRGAGAVGRRGSGWSSPTSRSGRSARDERPRPSRRRRCMRRCGRGWRRRVRRTCRCCTAAASRRTTRRRCSRCRTSTAGWSAARRSKAAEFLAIARA